LCILFQFYWVKGRRKTQKSAKMDAIKKKMQSMKLEKDNAMDRADNMEQTARDANARADRAEEEVRNLQKKMQQIENDFDNCQEQLMAANTKLEEKEKSLQNVCHTHFVPTLFFHSMQSIQIRIDLHS